MKAEMTVLKGENGLSSSCIHRKWQK